MNAVLDSAPRHLNELAGTAASLPGSRHDWLRTARAEARDWFQRHGFPTTRMEAWKYTSVAPIERTGFVARDEAAVVTADMAAALRYPELVAYELVFVNGIYAPALSRPADLPVGVTVSSLAAVLEDPPEPLKERVRARAATNPDAFAALNSAFLQDGAWVHVAPDTRLERPIHLLFIATSGEAPVASHPRIVAEIGEGASATLIETYAGFGTAANLVNTLTELRLGAGARVTHYSIQDQPDASFHVGKLFVHLGRDSQASLVAVSLGSALARSDLNVELAAPGAAVSLGGLYVAGGRQHIDHHTRVDHLEPHTTSEQLYKGVIGDAGRAVFNGRMIVHPHAQKAAAHQTNRNLLLSRDAEIDTKPELEIYADDVRCTHGATVGNLDEAALFYLRSRGIGEQTARSLLTHAFAIDVIDRIALQPIHDRIAQKVLGHLPEGALVKEVM